MKKRKKVITTILKVCTWCIGFGVIFFVCSGILKPKYFFDSASQSPETEMWKTFYEEPQNSIDVIFLGSSHIYNGVNPLVFYEETGLTGFDLASSSQDIPTGYFYLKEALEYQTPKYVLLDSYGILNKAFENEAAYKRSLDDMRWSAVKIEAIREWQKHLEGVRLLPRIFTIMDYHSRWDSLSEEDFSDSKFITNRNGYCPVFTADENVVYNAFDAHINEPEIDETTRKYIKSMVDLCENNNIKLCLISVPDTEWTRGNSTAIQKLANELSIPFLDYNTEELFVKIGIQDGKDWMNSGHLNSYGAEKFTAFLAESLYENEVLVNQSEKNGSENRWKQKIEKWNSQYQIGKLKETWTLSEYFDQLVEFKAQEYSIFMTVKEDASKFMNEEAVEKFQELGLKALLYDLWDISYYAVITPDEIYEEKGKEPLVYHGSTHDSEFSVFSAGKEYGNRCSVIINDTEYALNQRGLNIVVFDHERQKVIDSVCFDLHEPEWEAFR